MFSRHDWEMIDKTIIPAATKPGKFNSKSTEDTRLLLDAMREQVVHVFQCRDCGKVKTVKN